VTCLSQRTKEVATDELRFGCDGWNLIGTLNSQFSTRDTFVRNFGLSTLNLQLSTPFQPSTHFVSYDGNGNVTALVNAADGSESARYEYGPFGEVIRSSGPAVGSMVSVNPFRFSTKYQDDETDLLYYGYRYFNASTGRWISRDPIEEAGGLNLYGFVRNSSVNLVDPFGLSVNDPPFIVTVTVTQPGEISVSDGLQWKARNSFTDLVGGANLVHLKLSGRIVCGCIDKGSIKMDEVIDSRFGWSVDDRQRTIVVTPCAGGGYKSYSYTREVWWTSSVIKIPKWMQSQYDFHQYISVTVTISADGTTSRSGTGSQSGGWPWSGDADSYFTLVHLP
jgi:RHS repeat-associated protein